MQNWFWSLAVGVRGRVLRNVPDAGGPGGPSGSAGVDAGQSAGDGDGDPNPDAAAAGSGPQAHADEGDDDSLDDDDAGFDQAYHDELKSRDPKAAKKYRNAINRSKAAAPLLTTLRQLGIDPKDRNAVAAFLRNGVTPKPANAPAPVAPQPKHDEPAKKKWEPLRTDEPLDLSAYKDWNLDDPGTKALVHGHHEVRMQNRMLVNAFMAQHEEVEALKAQIKGLIEGTTREKTEAKVKQWRSVVTDAAGKIKDPELADSFRHAVAGEARFERAQGREPDIQAIVAKHLKRLTRTGQITPGEAAKATAAAQTIAERNRTGPSRSAFAPSGAPASPTLDRSNERVNDVSRRLVGRSYVGLGRR